MNVPEILRHTGLALNEQWLNTTAKDLLPLYLNSSSSSASSSSSTGVTVTTGHSMVAHEQAAETILERVLREDLRTCSLGTLPSQIHKLHKEILPGPYLVQIEEMIDIGSSRSSSNENSNGTSNGIDDDRTLHTSSSYARRCLKLALSDGSNQQIYGIEYNPIKDLSLQSYAGLKLLLKQIEIRRGLLLLTPSNTLVLGGGVPYLSYMQEEANIIQQQQQQQQRKEPSPPVPPSPSTTTGSNPSSSAAAISTNIDSRMPTNRNTAEAVSPFVPTEASIPRMEQPSKIISIDDDDDDDDAKPHSITTSSSTNPPANISMDTATRSTTVVDHPMIEPSATTTIVSSSYPFSSPSHSNDTVTVPPVPLTYPSATIVVNDWKALVQYSLSTLTSSDENNPPPGIDDHGRIVYVRSCILCFLHNFTYTNNEYSLSAFITDTNTGNEILTLIQKEKIMDRTDLMESIAKNTTTTTTIDGTGTNDIGIWMKFLSTSIQSLYLNDTEPNQLEYILRSKEKENKELRRKAKNMVADMEEKIYNDGKGKEKSKASSITSLPSNEEYHEYTGVTLKVEIRKVRVSGSTPISNQDTPSVEYFIHSIQDEI